MALFSLNRDILLYICSLLSRHDAFNFSLTCKTSREISLKYTCSEATCSTSDQIRALTTFMLAPEPGHDRPRATYLESLSISEDSYSDQESDEDAPVGVKIAKEPPFGVPPSHSTRPPSGCNCNTPEKLSGWVIVTCEAFVRKNRGSDDDVEPHSEIERTS